MSETENLPARQPTQAEAQRAKMDVLLKAVDERAGALVTLLKDTGIDFDRFREVFRRALIKNPDLLACDAASVIQACIDACTAGLLPDGRQGAIVPYNVNVAKRGEAKRWAKKAQFIAQYEGMLHVAYKSGNFRSIMAHIVYEGDDWDYELGITPVVKHKPKARPARAEGAPQYNVIATYAVAHTKDGGIFVEVFEPEDIRKVMAVSKAASGPTKDWPEQMARKGPLRRMWKFLPRNERMDRILEVDDEAFAPEEMEEAPARTLRTGFAPQAPKALEQGADQIVDIPMDMEGEGVEGIRAGTREDSAPSAEMRADIEPDAGPSNPEAESYAGARGEPEPEGDPVPEVAEYEEKLAKATGWLGAKQALKTFSKTEMGSTPMARHVALLKLWGRMQELRAGGQDKTDFLTDPIFFEAWLHATDAEVEAIEANWSVVQQDPKLTDEDRARIQERVDYALGAEPD